MAPSWRAGANFRCLLSDTPIDGDYIKAEGKAGRMGARLMAIVAEGQRGRVYLSPTPEHGGGRAAGQPDMEARHARCHDKLTMFGSRNHTA